MPDVSASAPLSRGSPFSYACRACSRCCHTHKVRVNPFDALVLARHLGLSTTEVLKRYVDGQSMLARRSENGACVFLGEGGCTVHPARPLVCRLYPLGREVTTDGREEFYHVRPHPQSDGVYGQRGTVDDYLTEQDTWQHVEASDLYLELFCRAVAALGSAPELPSAGASAETPAALSDLLDADATIARYHPAANPAELDAAGAMMLHIQTIDALLTQQARSSP